MTDIVQIGNVFPTKNRSNPNQGRVYSVNGIAPTLSCMSGGNLQPMIAESRKDMDKIVCERRTDEGLRTFKDDVCGTIRTISAGGINE